MNKQIADLKLNSNKLVGYHINTLNQKVQVEFDIEEKTPSMDDFSEIVNFANGFLTNLSTEKLTGIKNKIAEELTSAAYSDSSNKPTVEDERKLATQLKLQKINFFPEGVISMIFEGKEEYPDMLIYSQVNEDFSIEDVIVE